MLLWKRRIWKHGSTCYGGEFIFWQLIRMEFQFGLECVNYMMELNAGKQFPNFNRDSLKRVNRFCRRRAIFWWEWTTGTPFSSFINYLVNMFGQVKAFSCVRALDALLARMTERVFIADWWPRKIGLKRNSSENLSKFIGRLGIITQNALCLRWNSNTEKHNRSRNFPLGVLLTSTLARIFISLA